jgi:protease I
MEYSGKTDKKNVAIMATDGFEEIELTAPKEKLEKEGAMVSLIADKAILKSWKNHQWSKDFKVDYLLEDFRPDDYDALILPGGVINADRLRRNKKAIGIIKKFDEEGKIIAAICHGPQLLIEAGLVKGKIATSHTALKTDLINAGADFNENGVVVDKNYITAQGPKDIERFVEEIIEGLMRNEK